MQKKIIQKKLCKIILQKIICNITSLTPGNLFSQVASVNDCQRCRLNSKTGFILCFLYLIIKMKNFHTSSKGRTFWKTTGKSNTYYRRTVIFNFKKMQKYIAKKYAKKNIKNMLKNYAKKIV